MPYHRGSHKVNAVVSEAIQWGFTQFWMLVVGTHALSIHFNDVKRRFVDTLKNIRL
ncbi:hypothetical protein VPMS16_621, partial [Vibrio sp. 16]